MKTIKFVARDKYGWDVFPKPYPASQAIPKWWKDMTPYDISNENPDGKKVRVTNFISNATFKKCTPMLDALTSGYIVPLFSDVIVEQHEKLSIINWRVRGIDVFQRHGNSSQYVEVPPGYRNEVFKYGNCWIPRTPKGYSCLITAPFGYRNLPFQAIPAIVDTDKSMFELVVPMWIKDGVDGIVEKGTPMFQITPFKRESWKSEFDYLEDGEYLKIEDKGFNGTIVNHYIKNVWSKKSYR